MSRSKPAPPRFTRWWLEAFLPHGVVGETILGDLDEEYVEHAAASTPAEANAWYRRQALRVVLDYLLGRWFGLAPKSSAMPRALRGARGSHRLGLLGMDVRTVVRGFRREPGLFFTVILVLALGIGANTAVYSVVRSVLLEPLPYPQPDRVVRVRQTLASWRNHPNPILAGMADDFPVEWGVLLDWRRLSNSFDAIGVYRPSRHVLTQATGATWISTDETSSGVFAALAVPPALGRLFGPDNDVVGGEPTAILSHGFWSTAFGADPGVVGSTVVLTGVPYRIIGVMPEGFYFPTRATVLWTRLSDRYLRVYEGGQSLIGLARLKPGVSLEAARLDMDRVSARIHEERPDRSEGYGARVWTQQEYLVGDVRPVMTLLLAAVIVVLLIACANACGLILVRSNRRRRELAIRTSLGADRRRIFGQLVTESVLLTALAGVAALAVTAVTHRLLVELIPADIPRVAGIRLNGNVLLFSLGVTLVCGLVVGVLPALRASRLVEASAIGRGGRTTTADRGLLRAQGALVVAEVALTVPLVVATGLLAGSLYRLTTVELGIDPSGVYFVSSDPYGERYDTQDEVRVFRETLAERLGALPGVVQVSAADNSPYSESGSGGEVRIATGEDVVRTNVKWTQVHGPFFQLLGIRMVAGRSFDPSDRDEDGGVAIINRAMAERYWPSSDPLGELIYRYDDVSGRRIVGVVGNVRSGSPASPATPRVYLPDEAPPYTVVKSSMGVAAFRAAAARIVRDIDPDLPVSVLSLAEQVRTSTSGPRFRALLIGTFAALAATLALVGVGGILSYSVTQRRKEIGLRMVVGATGGQVMRAVLGSGLGLVTLGLLIGGGVTVVGVRLVRAFLFETSLGDPATLVGTTALLVGAGLAVSLLPAHRASRVDPATLLNAE